MRRRVVAKGEQRAIREHLHLRPQPAAFRDNGGEVRLGSDAG